MHFAYMDIRWLHQMLAEGQAQPGFVSSPGPRLATRALRLLARQRQLLDKSHDVELILRLTGKFAV